MLRQTLVERMLLVLHGTPWQIELLGIVLCSWNTQEAGRRPLFVGRCRIPSRAVRLMINLPRCRTKKFYIVTGPYERAHRVRTVYGEELRSVQCIDNWHPPSWKMPKKWAWDKMWCKKVKKVVYENTVDNDRVYCSQLGVYHIHTDSFSESRFYSCHLIYDRIWKPSSLPTADPFV